MEWMLMPLRRYAQFSGRARRKEYWMFVLFVFMVWIVLVPVEVALDLAGVGRSWSGTLPDIFTLVILVPSIAVAVRRLHDTDRSGRWLWVPILAGVPGAAVAERSFALGMVIEAVGGIVASIPLLFFLCQDGTHGDNRFGPDPQDPDLSQIFA